MWGSSFPVIKVVVSSVDEYVYTGFQGLLSVVFLTPYVVVYYRGRGWRFDWGCFRGGLFAGLFYGLGIWFQGWGTRFTSASNSAFITGLNVLFVYVYTALATRSFPRELFYSLLLGLSGLYLITSPGSLSGIGDLLVLIGAFMWAGQIIVFDKYSYCNPLILSYYMFIPSLLYNIALIIGPRRINGLNPTNLLLLTYLAIACSIGAITLQAYGQKKVPPETTATIFLLEPILAAIYSNITLHETLQPKQILGAALILAAIYTTTRKQRKMVAGPPTE